MMPELAARGLLLMGQFYKLDGPKKKNEDLKKSYRRISLISYPFSNPLRSRTLAPSPSSSLPAAKLKPVPRGGLVERGPFPNVIITHDVTAADKYCNWVIVTMYRQ